MNLFIIAIFGFAVVLAASTFSSALSLRHPGNFNNQKQHQQQQRELVHAWELGFHTGVYVYQPTKVDKQESFLTFDEDNNFARIRSSTGQILFNISVPPESVTFPGESLLFEETSIVTGTTYVAVQQSNNVNAYSFNADHKSPSEPISILQLSWAADEFGISNNVIITTNDILIVPWLENDGASYQLKAFDINPASKTTTNRSTPIYSVSVGTIESGCAHYAGGVYAITSLDSTSGRTRGYDGNTGKLLWTSDLGTSSAKVFSAREAGFFFYYEGELSPSALKALDARTGKIVFTFETPEPITAVSVVAENPRLVRLVSFNLYILLDTHTGKAVKQVSVGKQIFDTFQVLLGDDTRALVFHYFGNNSLWDLTTGSRLGEEIQWQCWEVNKPLPSEMCSRPPISSARADGNSSIFTLYNPVPSGRGYYPIVLDANTGAVIATNTQDSAYWDDAPDVLALSPSSNVAVYFGFGGPDGTSAVGYRLQ